MKLPVSLPLFIFLSTSIVISTSKTVISPASSLSVAVNTDLNISCSVDGGSAANNGLQLYKCIPQSCEVLEPVHKTNTTYFYKQTFDTVRLMFIDYICNTTAETDDSSHLQVIVGYKPKLPDTVYCVSLNQAELKCTWNKLDTNIHNTVKSTWNITYSDGVQAYRDCPEPKPVTEEKDSTVHCNIPSDNPILVDTFESSSNYTMNVTLNNNIGVVSRLYQIIVSNIVKLTPPNLRIKPDKDTLDVLLELPKDYAFHRDFGAVVEYVVTYRATWSNQSTAVTVSSREEKVSLLLKDCVPHTTYFVTMKAKPIKSQYWSDVINKTISTEPDVPYESPDTSPGLYAISNNTPERKGFTVFYKPLLEKYWNSKDCKVNVIISDQINDTLWTGNFTISDAFLEIPFEITDSAYTATFRYVNNIGASENSTTLLITKQDSEMIVTAEETDTGYLITWDMYDVNSSAITVMWCTRKTATTCLTDIQWKYFPNPGSSVYLTGIGHEKNKLFAVAVHQENKTSRGLTFPKCYYTLQNSQDSTKLPFTAERLDISHQLVVKLVSLYCQYPSKPVLYQVFYKEHKDGRLNCQDVISDLATNVTRPAAYDLHTIVLSNTDPETSYDVCLGVTLANSRTLFSDVQTVKRSDLSSGNGDDSIHVLGAVFGCSLLLVLIIASGYYIRRKCCVGDTDIKIPPIESFENPGYNHDLPDEKDFRDIADSGTHSLPESLSSDDQCTEGDGESVSSSGIGSTKCDSDVISPPVTPTDAEKPHLLFKAAAKPSKPSGGKTCGTHPMEFRMAVLSENENSTSEQTTSNGPELSSSCSNPIDSYMKGDIEENELNTLRNFMENSGNFSGGYKHVLYSNSSSPCASDSENLDTCPSSPELERAASRSTLCDSDAVDSSGITSSWSGAANYNLNIQIDSSGDHMTLDGSNSTCSKRTSSNDTKYTSEAENYHN